MLKSTRVIFLAIAALALSQAVAAADMKEMKSMSSAATEQAQGLGVVKAVNAQAGTVTIAHEPIKSFEWPAMTMAFKVADPALLKNVAVGNKVQFTLQGKDMMKSTVTSLKVTG